MREILFRGKSIETVDDGEWVYGYYNVHRGGFDDEHHEYIQEKCGINHMVDSDTVGQFTGLLDKNGNKIFEGDILETEYSKVICEFGTGDFSIGCHCYQGWCFTDLEQDDSARLNFNDSRYVQEYDVIGNKWDNPELLNS